jgi:hypothetical protein
LLYLATTVPSRTRSISAMPSWKGTAASSSMANPDPEMPRHVEAVHKDAVDNIIFLKRQQWVATNYALLVYAAIFVISAQFFPRTDFARNSLGIVAIVTFFVHYYIMFLFQRAMDKFRARLYWIYRTLLQRRGAGRPGFAARATIILGPLGRCRGACPCLIRWSCFDYDLFVVNPLTR